jgi:hypothetical protein
MAYVVMFNKKEFGSKPEPVGVFLTAREAWKFAYRYEIAVITSVSKDERHEHHDEARAFITNAVTRNRYKELINSTFEEVDAESVRKFRLARFADREMFAWCDVVMVTNELPA